MENTNMPLVATVAVIFLIVGAGFGYYMAENPETPGVDITVQLNPNYVTQDTFDGYTNWMWFTMAISVIALLEGAVALYIIGRPVGG